MADFPDSTPVTEISRPIVEAEIELLIGLLDTLDPDPDLEDSIDQEGDTADDEPDLGAPNQQAGAWNGISFHDDDREDDPSDDEPELGWTAVQARTGRYGWDDSNAYEPSLASTNSLNQTYWWRGRMDDSEDEHDGREDDSDFEPWLGAFEPTYHGSYSRNSIKDMIHHHMRPDFYAGIQTERTSEISQERWAGFSSDDREWDDEREPEDEGTSCYIGPCSPIETMLKENSNEI